MSTYNQSLINILGFRIPCHVCNRLRLTATRTWHEERIRLSRVPLLCGQSLDKQISRIVPSYASPRPPIVLQVLPVSSSNEVRRGSRVFVPCPYEKDIAKLIGHGADRPAAIATVKAALEDFAIEGVKSTIPIHLRVLEDPAFVSGEYDTRIIGNLLGGNGGE